MLIRQNLLHLRLKRDQREALPSFGLTPPTLTLNLNQQPLLLAGWFAWSAGGLMLSGPSMEPIEL